MKTKTMVEPTAEMVRIVTLKRGDVYKRLVEDPYNSAKKKIVVGVVTDVLHNGETAALTAIEVTDTYGSVEVKVAAFSGDDDLTLYPASTREVETVLGEAVERQRGTVERTENEAAKARATLETLHSIRTEALTAAQSEPVVIEAKPEPF